VQEWYYLSLNLSTVVNPPVWLALTVVFLLFFSISIVLTLLLNLPWYFHYDYLWGWYPPIPPNWGMAYYIPLFTSGGIGTGMILLTIGFIILFSALRALGISRAFGKEIYETKEKSTLIKTGIYAYTRNPLYVGATIMFFGWVFVALFTFLFIVTIMFMILFYFVAKLEEKELEERFGKEYTDYKESVPLFIPYPKKRFRRKKK
ncbi:MAG: methyltransferase family protein, partial [Candidatus Jordarchaeum sp.]|uniref:methyltransferase family protein n=1 Tax=Candidatus Jordarchaeum sp. TaxID=2823881 RepID=UPI004049098C